MMMHFDDPHYRIPLTPAFAALFSLVLSCGCEDPLPVYEQPVNIFETSFVRLTPDTVTFFDRDGLAERTRFPGLTITYAVKNIYEETIQFTLSLSGTLEIWLPNRPDLNALYSISDQNITPTSAYNYSTGTLTLNPGQSLFLQSTIDPKLTTGFYIHKYAAVRHLEFRYSEYMYYFYYEPMTIKHRLTIRLGSNLTGLSTTGEMTLVMTGMVPMPRN